MLFSGPGRGARSTAEGLPRIFVFVISVLGTSPI